MIRVEPAGTNFLPHKGASALALRRGAPAFATWTTLNSRREGARSIVLSSRGPHCVLGLVDAVGIEESRRIEVIEVTRGGAACVTGLLLSCRRGPLPRTTIAELTIQCSTPVHETRHQVRVNAVTSGIIVTHEENGPWPLLDLAPTGFGMQRATPFRRAQRINVTLTSPNEQSFGTVIVRYCREQPPGWFRCGITVPPYSPAIGAFVQRASTALQGEHVALLETLQKRFVR